MISDCVEGNPKASLNLLCTYTFIYYSYSGKVSSSATVMMYTVEPLYNGHHREPKFS